MDTGFPPNRLFHSGAAKELSLMRPQFFELRSGDGPFRGECTKTPMQGALEMGSMKPSGAFRPGDRGHSSRERPVPWTSSISNPLKHFSVVRRVRTAGSQFAIERLDASSPRRRRETCSAHDGSAGSPIKSPASPRLDRAGIQAESSAPRLRWYTVPPK